MLCGLGHVAGSLLLVAAGMAIGTAAARLPEMRALLERTDGLRGDLAAWGLVAVGVAYGLWGIRHAVRTREGLTLVGVPEGAAFAAALTHRLCTNYLPPVAGFFTTRWLTARDYL